MVAKDAVRFLLTADWQIGLTRHFLDSDAQARYTQARIDGIREAGHIATHTECEFIVCCGDVFDANQLPKTVIGRAMEAMGESDIPVYLLPGNHDPLDRGSVYLSSYFRSRLREFPNIHILDKPGRVLVRSGLDNPGVEIIAAPWPIKRPRNNPLAEVLEKLQKDDQAERLGGVDSRQNLAISRPIRIVAAHGGTNVLAPSDDPTILSGEELLNAVEEGLVDFIGIGDRHSTTDIQECLGKQAIAGDGAIWYPGTQEVTAFDDVEKDPGNVLVVELMRRQVSSKSKYELGQGNSSGTLLEADTHVHVHVDKHHIGTWSMMTFDQELDSDDDIDALEKRLSAIAHKERVIVKIGLRGSISVAGDSELERIFDPELTSFASLRRRDSHSSLTVGADIRDFEELRGYAFDAAQELLAILDAQPPGSPRAQEAQDALVLLHRLSKEGQP